MSHLHKEELLRTSLMTRDESFDDAIDYRVQVLSHLGPDHPLFERGCVDLLTILIDSRTISKAFTAVEHEYGVTGDAVAVAKIMKLFTSAATTVLARTGLGNVPLEAPPTKNRKTLNPNAISYGSPALTATTVERTASTAMPALSSSASTPQRKDERSQAATPPAPATANMETKQGWGKRQVHLTGLPDSLDEHRLSIEVDKYMGDLVAFDYTTKEALVSFPAVTAGDMLASRKVVIANKACTVDDNTTPLRQNVVVIDGPSATEELDWSSGGGKEIQVHDSTNWSSGEVQSPTSAEEAQSPALNGLDASKHAEPTTTRTDSTEVEEPASTLDTITFHQWRNKAAAASIGNKYRREQPVEAVEEVTDMQQQEPAPGGWDDIANEQIFSLTQTFPWNHGSVSRAMVHSFGKDALALYSVPIQHDKYNGYKHEQTVTYYAKFRPSKAPERTEQRVCLVPDGGDGGKGWDAIMRPENSVAPGSRIVVQPGLVGHVDYDEFSLLD